MNQQIFLEEEIDFT